MLCGMLGPASSSRQAATWTGITGESGDDVACDSRRMNLDGDGYMC